MMQIKNRYTGAVIYEAEAERIKQLVEMAVASGAYLGGANLGGAYLGVANLDEAYLGGANLGGANLDGAYLGGAYLGGATYGEGVPMSKAPMQVLGLRWPVYIFDSHIKIGCQLHATGEWVAFDDRRIAEMDGRRALKFWNKYKTIIMAAAEVHQK